MQASGVPFPALSPSSPAIAMQACLQSPAVFELLPPLDFPYTRPPPQLRIWFSAPIPGLAAHLSSAAPGQPQPQPKAQPQQPQQQQQEQLSAHQATPGVAAAAGTAAAARSAPVTTVAVAVGRDALPAAAATAALKRALGAIAAHSRGAGSRSGGRVSGSINIRPGSAQNTPGGSGNGGRREYVFQHKDLPGLLQKVLKASRAISLQPPQRKRRLLHASKLHCSARCLQCSREPIAPAS